MDIDGLDSQPLTPGQVGRWADLCTAILAADENDDIFGEEDLADEFSDPLWDCERGSIAVYDTDQMVGYCGVVSRRAADPIHEMRLYGGVHPDYRGRGIGSALLDWSERAALVLHEERFPGQPVALGGDSLATNASAIALFADHGYTQARWFNQMVRDLSAVLPAPVVPDDVEIAGFTAERSADALAVRNDAFRDHWGSTDESEESWEFRLALSAFRPSYSLVAYLAGEPVGVLMAHEYEAYNKAKDERDLYIPLVGTARAARGHGIASALLATALTAAKADGFDTATLDVDADSPTGAVRLYERAGFAVKKTGIAHRKVLRA